MVNIIDYELNLYLFQNNYFLAEFIRFMFTECFY